MQHLATLDLLFSGQQPIRFNRLTNKLYIDWDWKNDINEGEYIVVEAIIITDPSTYTKVWNDRMLKKLAVAYVKKQWGANMGKFDKMLLPGGVALRGGEMYAEAMNEIAMIEQNIRDTYEAPPGFLMG